jgi:hypothetical protein
MIQISTNQGFGLLQAYCRRRTEVRLKGYLGGEHAESNATIVEASADDGEVCFRLFEESQGPSWLCKISLAGASFSFDHVVEPEAPKTCPNWRHLLRIENPDGSELLLGDKIPTN